MPAIWADFKLNTAKLDTLMASTQAAADNAAAEEAAEIVQGCKRRSRERTGAMRRGWNRQRIGVGRRAGWRIYDSVPYTIYNEFGTSRMSAQPMLGPEMRAARSRLGPRLKKWITAGTRYFVSPATGERLSEYQL
jgi:HK97 gp10 family phage protein